MSTSVISRLKTVFAYLAVSVLLILFETVYTSFGHGVSSAYMTWMFLYPLLGGAIIFLLLATLAPDAARSTGYRLFYNLYNSGIALLTAGSLMKGIFEIAGTDSPYSDWYYIAGGLFMAAGLLILLFGMFKSFGKRCSNQ